MLTMSPVCRLHVTQQLQRAKCEVPDVLALTMCARCNANDSAAARKCVAQMPAAARALVQSATHASEPPIVLQLPHTQAIGRLQSMKRVVPQVPHARAAPCTFRGLHQSQQSTC